MNKEYTRQHMTDEQRDTFPMEGRPSIGGGFEILCITAGNGNGWEFSPEVLEAAVPLFDNIQCFIDHMPLDSTDGHSIRDLAGLISDPVWDPETQGIKARLSPMGPGADILTETAAEILAMEGTDTKVGFSADLGFINEGSRVVKIEKIYSVDFVVDPARGGALLRALNSLRQRKNPDEMRTQLSSEVAQTRALRAEMCRHLLDTSLSASGLPTPIRDRIRKQFSGRIFEPDELNDAIDDGRLLLASLNAGRSVAGISGQISGTFNTHDQLSAAVHDLLGAKRPAELRNAQPARLTGIRELYTMMTGDWDFHGGYYPERVQLSNTTASLPGILKNALNKLIAQRWEELGDSGYR